MVCGMTLPPFEYAEPCNRSEACDLLAEAKGEASLLAGGTDLLVKLKHGKARPRLLIGLGRIEGLAGVIEGPGGGLRIGPRTTMHEVAAHPLLRARWSALAEGAASVGGPIIRNRATLGGNIITARPCADTAPPLLVLGATLRLERTAGARTVDLEGFITGPGRTGIAPDELLAAIELPAPATRARGSAYLKFTRRAAMEVTIAGCAAAIDLVEDRVTRARVVLTSVGPTPLAVPEVEALLQGRTPDAAALAEAADAARRAARPIDDHRAPGRFRSQVVEVLARRALERAVARAREARS